MKNKVLNILMQTHYASTITTMLMCGLTLDQVIGRFLIREYSDWVFKKHTEHLLIDEKVSVTNISKELLEKEISNIEYSFRNKIVTITLGRPGLLIGKGGSYLSQVEKVFKEWGDKFNIEIDNIKLIEEQYPFRNDLFHSIDTFYEI